MHDTRCVQNVWSELTGNTHFNINELAHNDVRAPSAQQDGGVGREKRKGPVSKRQFGDKSSVIKHFGGIWTTAEGGDRGLFDGWWVAWSPVLVIC